MKKGGLFKKIAVGVLVLVCIAGILFLNTLSQFKREEDNKIIRKNLNNIRQYGLDFYTTETFEKICEDEQLLTALSAAEQASQKAGECNSSIHGWAVTVPLRGGMHYCVDFQGVDKERENILGIDVKC